MRHGSRQASRRDSGFPPRVLLAAIGFLSALQGRGETAATGAGRQTRWQAETVFQFAARSDYAGTQGHVRRRDAIVGTAHLRFASPARPIIAGLMLEYRFVDEQANMLLIGGTLAYKMPKWSAAASLFHSGTAQHAAGGWQYFGSVRRHVTRRHSLGVELSGALETGRPAKWMLGYDGTITEALSISVAAGSGFDAGRDWIARTSVTWRPRPGRR